MSQLEQKQNKMDEENIETTYKKSPDRAFSIVKTEIEIEETESEGADAKSLLS